MILHLRCIVCSSHTSITHPSLDDLPPHKRFDPSKHLPLLACPNCCAEGILDSYTGELVPALEPLD